MEDKPVGQVVSMSSPHRPLHWLKSRWFVVAAVLVALVVGYMLILKVMHNAPATTTEKVLTIDDLKNPDVKLDSETSSASVDNLTRALKAKIDKQIIAKENPFDTVDQLAGVLANTTNITRQNQLTNFLEDFLAKREDTLRFATASETPDQAQVNYWKAELYAKLVYNYQLIMQSGFTGSDGKPIDTTKQQLKYINLYLALANDPASHPPIPKEYREIFPGYVYVESGNFLKLKNSLTSERLAQ